MIQTLISLRNIFMRRILINMSKIKFPPSPSQFFSPPRINVRKTLTHFLFFRVQKSIFPVLEKFLNRSAHCVFLWIFWVRWIKDFTASRLCNNLGSPSPHLQVCFFCEHCETLWMFHLVNDEKYNYFPWASWRIKRRDYVQRDFA